jgi:glutamyl-Q tRNA(Asp) synthetase
MSVTRFAPSPTGYLHLGHAYAAITAARAGEHFLLRIEDLDQGRAREEFVTAIFEDLGWMGLDWPLPVLRQSARMAAYKTALDVLAAENLVYPCFCTRTEIADEIARAVEAQHGPDGPLYPGTCRALSPASRAEALAAGKPYVQRLDCRTAAAKVGPLTFVEHGKRYPVDATRFGDVVLARKDMPAAYHLAVVVDDAFQGVSLVTRGEDLLPATHVQRLLQALLALPEPAYAHHRLILDEQGRKFSKRDQAATLRGLREAGITPQAIFAQLGL